MTTPSDNFGPAIPPQPTPGIGLLKIMWLWFGVSRPVGRRAYAITGLTLTVVKYAVEACVIHTFAFATYMPSDFINPFLSVRTELLKLGPDWLPWALFLWTLPFLWIAVSMSVRRAADAGNSPWLGFFVLIPLFNLFLMVGLCLQPSAGAKVWGTSMQSSGADRARSALLAICASLCLGALMLIVSVYLLGSYGTSLFFGTPFVMGAVAGNLYNRPQPRGYAESASIGLFALLVAVGAMLLFALEGVICIAMAAPLLLPLGALGGLLGKAIADVTTRHRGEWIASALPLLAMSEAFWSPPQQGVVLSQVEIDASPEMVWNHVLSFPELPPPHEWYFRCGISCPQRARIVGAGPGATRYCEFTTGTFVEPITAWEESRRLAFDVSEQPAPMFELSPYHDLHPPHLDGYLRSTRGEFRLIPLPGNRTRLEGRTWYTLDIRPHDYWSWWSQGVIHGIHLRVLRHIKQLAEAPQPQQLAMEPRDHNGSAPNPRVGQPANDGEYYEDHAIRVE